MMPVPPRSIRSTAPTRWSHPSELFRALLPERPCRPARSPARAPGGRALLAALAVCLLVGATEAARADGPPAGLSPSLSVTAKLVEVPTQFPPDDLYDYAYVMRYQVIGGPMDKQSILVAHYKPRQPRAKLSAGDPMKAEVSGKVRSFKVGDTHKLVLSPDLKKIWKGALVDEFAATDHKSVRYWALVADPG
jgi:hypothetical protein